MTVLFVPKCLQSTDKRNLEMAAPSTLESTPKTSQAITGSWKFHVNNERVSVSQFTVGGRVAAVAAICTFVGSHALCRLQQSRLPSRPR